MSDLSTKLSRLQDRLVDLLVTRYTATRYNEQVLDEVVDALGHLSRAQVHQYEAEIRELILKKTSSWEAPSHE
jgi:hypothetical protein